MWLRRQARARARRAGRAARLRGAQAGRGRFREATAALRYATGRHTARYGLAIRYGRRAARSGWGSNLRARRLWSVVRSSLSVARCSLSPASVPPLHSGGGYACLPRSYVARACAPPPPTFRGRPTAGLRCAPSRRPASSLSPSLRLACSLLPRPTHCRPPPAAPCQPFTRSSARLPLHYVPPWPLSNSPRPAFTAPLRRAALPLLSSRARPCLPKVSPPRPVRPPGAFYWVGLRPPPPPAWCLGVGGVAPSGSFRLVRLAWSPFARLAGSRPPGAFSWVGLRPPPPPPFGLAASAVRSFSSCCARGRPSSTSSGCGVFPLSVRSPIAPSGRCPAPASAYLFRRSLPALLLSSSLGFVGRAVTRPGVIYPLISSGFTG